MPVEVQNQRNSQIRRNVESRRSSARKRDLEYEKKNIADRNKYLTRSRKNVEGYQRDVENYKALVSAGWDVSRIYTNKDHRPIQPRLYERNSIFEHQRVSPLKLGKRLSGTRFGGF
jgi:hypothetical protein